LIKHRVPFNDISRRYQPILDSLTLELANTLRSGHFLNGEQTSQFQERFSNYVGVDFCVGVSSGTTALELALGSLQLPKDAKVLMAANAGGYGAIAARRNNLKPHFVDVDENGLLCPENIISALDGVAAVIVTHLYGQSVDLEQVSQILKSRNIFLIEDCAQTIGGKVGSKRAGSFGHLSTFSFYPTKNLGSMGDAGAVCTSDSLLFERIKKLREYGWTEKYFSNIPNGLNGRIDEFHSLILNFQLNSVDNWNSRRRSIWKRYELAAQQSGLRLIGCNSESFVGHLAVIDCPNRKQFITHMERHQVDTAVHYPYPDYKQPGIFPESNLVELRNTERLCSSVVSIPLFPELTEEEILTVEEALVKFEI
jgi:dTDP-4-amino-4,6-dideoxygalactose transaminase